MPSPIRGVHFHVSAHMCRCACRYTCTCVHVFVHVGMCVTGKKSDNHAKAKCGVEIDGAAMILSSWLMSPHHWTV